MGLGGFNASCFRVESLRCRVDGEPQVSNDPMSLHDPMCLKSVLHHRYIDALKLVKR